MPAESGSAAARHPSGEMSSAQGALQAHPGSSRFSYAHEQAIPLPTPKLPATWRAPAVQLPPVRGPARKGSEPRVAQKEATQNSARLPAHSAQASQPVQEEASGYMSTESDSDKSPRDKVKGKKKSESIRDYKGQSRQMITMAFLEEGGYFDVPIQVASQRLGLGVTTLKRVCRASNMKRWPFRKRNSLGRLIDRTKQVLDDGTGQDNMQKLAALQVLEKQRQVMRSCQSQDMDEKIKSYRQAIFKLDHAERKRSEAVPNPLTSKQPQAAASAMQRIIPDSHEAAAQQPHAGSSTQMDI